MFFLTIQDCIKKHPRLVLCSTIFLSALLVYYQYVFGNSLFLFNDIGADTQQQYIMQYNSIVNHIRNGNFSIWDFSNGFGTSLLHLNLFDPSLALLFLCGSIFGPEVMAYFLIYLHIGKMVLAGLMCYQFLSCFSFSSKSRLLASYLYAFNGFLIVWGQHYQFSMISVYLPLFLYLLEKALQRDRFSPSIPLITTCIIIYSYYTGYMTMITGGIYLIVRLFFMEKISWKKRFHRFFLNCGSMILGICMGLFSLLPGFALVTNVSSRLENSTGLFQRIFSNLAPYPWRYYPTLLFRFFSSNLEGIGNDTIQMPYCGYANYYEAPNVFFSTLFVILAVQFLFSLFRNKEECKIRLTQWFLVFLVGTSLLLMIGSLIFNGFSAPFSRHTFLLMPLFALLTAKMSDEILDRKFFSYVGASFTILNMIILYYLCYKRIAVTPSAKLNILVLCGTGVLLIFLLFLASKKQLIFRLRPMLLYSLIFFCTALNVICDSHITVRGRSSVAKGDPAYFNYLYNDDMNRLLNYLSENDPTFYRLEKTTANVSLCMESCAQNYRGISSYNSTMNRNIIEFTEHMLPNMNLVNFSRITYRHILHDDVFATLFGIKYLVSSDGTYNSDSYRLIKQFGSLYLYENQYPASIGRLYSHTIDKASYEADASKIDNSALIQYLAITDEAGPLSVSPEQLASYHKDVLPNYIDYETPTIASAWNSDTHVLHWTTDISIPLDSQLQNCDAPVTMSFDICPNLPTEINFSTNNGFSDTTDYELTMTQANQIYHVSLTIPEDTQILRCITRHDHISCDLSNITFTSQSPASGFSKNTGIVVNQTVNDSHLSGQISASENSLAFFSIPFEEGWTATLDGKPIDLIRTDYGFSGFYVSSGEHTFTLTYNAPLLKQGLILSGIFWTLYLIIVIFQNKTKRT